MKANDRTTRLLQTWLESEAPQQVPAGLFTRIDTATRARTPRAAWLARLEGHHMDVIEGGRRPAIPRLAFIIAILAVVAAAAFGIMAVGSQQPGPVDSPAASPTSGATPNQTSAPGVTPSGGATAPMQPLPDSLIGAWYGSGPQFVWFLRSGESACSAFARSTGDCAVIEPGTGARSGGAAGLVNGELVIAWTSGYCNPVISRYGYSLNGDSLVLTERPGGCDGGNLALTRAGTGSAPTAPPRPTP